MKLRNIPIVVSLVLTFSQGAWCEDHKIVPMHYMAVAATFGLCLADGILCLARHSELLNDSNITSTAKDDAASNLKVAGHLNWPAMALPIGALAAAVYSSHPAPAIALGVTSAVTSLASMGFSIQAYRAPSANSAQDRERIQDHVKTPMIVDIVSAAAQVIQTGVLIAGYAYWHYRSLNVLAI